MGGSGPPSTKGADMKLKGEMQGPDRKVNSGRGGQAMHNSSSYGAVMARGGNL